MRTSVALLAWSAVGLAASTNYTIDINSVSASTRSSWCAGQQNTCSMLCANNPKTDSCDPSTLLYDCTCQNSSAPGLEYYLQTMPTFVCNEAFAECINNNANNATGQAACKTDIQDNCGTLDPSKADTSTPTTSSATVAATASASASAASTASTVSTSSSQAGAMPTKFAHYGNGAAAVAVGVFAYLL